VAQEPDESEPARGRRDSAARRAAAARLEAVRTFGTLGTLGLSVVIALVLGTALGLWLDRLTGWSPAFFIVGFLMGLAAGVLNIYRTMSRFSK
jgi:ATP synthase protein I